MRNFFNKAVLKISSFFDTSYFAMMLAGIELLCYYLGLDLVVIVVISLVTSFAFLFKKNLNCLLVIFLFMSTMISLKNSPANEDLFSNSGYYFQPGVYITCIVFAAIPVGIVIFTAIKNFVQKKISFDKVALSTILVGIAFLLSGSFSKTYNPLNTMFGGFMFFFFVVLFFAVIPYVNIDKNSISIVSKQVAIFLLVPLVEMIVYYIVYFAQGNEFDYRLYILLGWGNRNTLGMLFTVTLPFLLFLIKYETKKGYKALFGILAVLSITGTVFTFSRQAYLFMFVLITFYLGILLYTANNLTRNKYKRLLFFWCVGIAGLLLACEISGFFESIGMNGVSYSRIGLWLDAVKAFKENMFFGEGFFYNGGDPKVQLASIMPYCCHNTLFQMIGSCGLIGIVTYVFYRIATIKKVMSGITVEKSYPAMACAIIILMSLIDIHLFDLFGSGLYVILLAMSMAKNNLSENNNVSKQDIKEDAVEIKNNEDQICLEEKI